MTSEASQLLGEIRCANRAFLELRSVS